ncbi:MAG TPA: hypothetical protein VMF29_09590, partial [Candidatus Edwardsbacteria bacterium]|nr:hypothetical protein [Candidatus Edwardsbacteria bacterium]
YNAFVRSIIEKDHWFALEPVTRNILAGCGGKVGYEEWVRPMYHGREKNCTMVPDRRENLNDTDATVWIYWSAWSHLMTVEHDTVAAESLQASLRQKIPSANFITLDANKPIENHHHGGK